MKKRSLPPQPRGFTILELLVSVSVLSILVAVAIPSFQNFAKRSKTTEAILNSNAIVQGAIAWFESSHSSPSGDSLPQHFPNHLSPKAIFNGLSGQTTPAHFPCLSPFSRGARYSRKGNHWNEPIWNALLFALHSDFYYQYNYTASGIEKNADFSVVLFGDLDCDLTLSTYEVNGSIHPQTYEILISQMIVSDGLE